MCSKPPTSLLSVINWHLGIRVTIKFSLQICVLSEISSSKPGERNVSVELKVFILLACKENDQ